VIPGGASASGGGDGSNIRVYNWKAVDVSDVVGDDGGGSAAVGGSMESWMSMQIVFGQVEGMFWKDPQ